MAVSTVIKASPAKGKTARSALTDEEKLRLLAGAADGTGAGTGKAAASSVSSASGYTGGGRSLDDGGTGAVLSGTGSAVRAGTGKAASGNSAGEVVFPEDLREPEPEPETPGVTVPAAGSPKLAEPTIPEPVLHPAFYDAVDADLTARVTALADTRSDVAPETGEAGTGEKLRTLAAVQTDGAAGEKTKTGTENVPPAQTEPKAETPAPAPEFTAPRWDAPEITVPKPGTDAVSPAVTGSEATGADTDGDPLTELLLRAYADSRPGTYTADTAARDAARARADELAALYAAGIGEPDTSRSDAVYGQMRELLDGLLARQSYEPDTSRSDGWYDAMEKLWQSAADPVPFVYDPENDPVYRQYREQYLTGGRRAMEDAAGQAAALTGGYGSTYGESLGQSAYGQYLSRLNDVLPELYDDAYGRWLREREAERDRFDLASRMYDAARDAETEDYRRWLDLRKQAASDLGLAADVYDRAFDAEAADYDRSTDALDRLYRGWSMAEDAYDAAADEEREAYSRFLDGEGLRGDAFDRALDLTAAAEKQREARADERRRELERLFDESYKSAMLRYDYDKLNADQRYRYDSLNADGQYRYDKLLADAAAAAQKAAGAGKSGEAAAPETAPAGTAGTSGTFSTPGTSSTSVTDKDVAAAASALTARGELKNLSIEEKTARVQDELLARGASPAAAAAAAARIKAYFTGNFR